MEDRIGAPTTDVHCGIVISIQEDSTIDEGPLQPEVAYG